MMQVVRDGVECPSLSPDGTRLVYKSRSLEGGRLIWRLRVVDLASGRETELAETRSVDDQAEWLDDSRVLYGLTRATAGSGSSDVWAARADGTGTPELFIADAFSPSVVRVGQ
jgi:Tol biopolymer transport system component